MIKLGLAAIAGLAAARAAQSGRRSTRFNVGETLILDSPHTRGIPGLEKTPVNYRGKRGFDQAVVVSNGMQMTVPLAWLSRAAQTGGQRARSAASDRRSHQRELRNTVTRWMYRNAGSFADPRTGEVNMTRLAEEAADVAGEDHWLDDPDHWIWEVAADVAGPTLR